MPDLSSSKLSNEETACPPLMKDLDNVKLGLSLIRVIRMSMMENGGSEMKYIGLLPDCSAVSRPSMQVVITVDLLLSIEAL